MWAGEPYPVTITVSNTPRESKQFHGVLCFMVYSWQLGIGIQSSWVQVLKAGKSANEKIQGSASAGTEKPLMQQSKLQLPPRWKAAVILDTTSKGYVYLSIANTVSLAGATS